MKIKYLLISLTLIISANTWAENKEIYCELTGFTKYLERGSGESTLPLKVTINISISEDEYGNGELKYVQFRQQGVQTPLYNNKSEFSSSVNYRKIFLKYFLDEKKPHPIINLNTRVYEIVIDINRLTGKAFLDGNIQGVFIESDSTKTFLRDFLDADGDCSIHTERKF